MKRLVKLFSLLLIFTAFVSCDNGKDPDNENNGNNGNNTEPKTPFVSDLATARPSGDVALFTWKGEGDVYEIKIYKHNVEEPVLITDIKETSYRWVSTETGRYTAWEVRAKVGDNYSDWSKLEGDFYIHPAIPEGTTVEIEFKGEKWTATSIPYALSTTITSYVYPETFDGVYLIAEQVADGYATFEIRIPLQTGLSNIIDYDGYNLHVTYHEKKSNTDPITGMFVGDWIFIMQPDAGTINIESMDDMSGKGISGEAKILLINFDDYYQGKEDMRTEEVIVKFTNLKLTSN